MSTVVKTRRNLAANPSFSGTAANNTVRTNLCPNPSLETDTTGWSTVNGSTGQITGTRRTDGGYSGSAYYRATVTVGYTSMSNVGWIALPMGAITGGSTYTISAWLRSSVARSINLDLVSTTSGTTGEVFSPAVALAANTWTRISYTWVIPSGATPNDVRVRPISNDSQLWAAGETLDVDAVLIENAGFLGSYFDGNTTSLNLIANPSFEAGTTGWNPDTGSPTLTSDSTRAYSGTKSLKLVSGVASDDIAASVNVTLAANTTYTLSYYVYSPDARTSSFDIAGTGWTPSGRGVTTIPAGAWTRVVNTFTTPATAPGNTTFYLHNKNGPTTVGTALWIDAVLLEAGSTASPYYDGSAAAPGDFTFAWNGAANNSPSLQIAPGISWWMSRWFASGNGVAYQTQSGYNGGPAMRKLWLVGTTGLAQDVGINTPNSGAGMVPVTPGQTYTASVYVRCSVGNWITATIQWNDASGTKISQTPDSNTQLPTPNSWVRCSITATAPAGAATMQFTAGPYANAVVMPAGATLDYDLGLIEPTAVLGAYFDGSTPAATDTAYSPAGVWTYTWDSTSGTSTSTAVETIPLQDYQVQLPDGSIVGAGQPVGYTEMSGIRDLAPLRGADTDRAGHDGAIPGMSYLTGRAVGIKFLIAAPPGGAEAALQTLSRNWQNITDPSAVAMIAGDYLLQFATGGTKPVSAVQVQLPGRPVPLLALGKPSRLGAPIDSRYQFGWLEVDAEWEVPDGKLYDATVNVASCTVATPAGGAAFPWHFPVHFPVASGGSLTVANAGAYPARPVFRITGPVTNPRISNPATGQAITVNLALQQGDVLVIDTQSRVVRLNGANRNNALDVGSSSFFTIPPGGALLRFSSSDSTAVAAQLIAYTLNTYSVV